MTRVTTEFQVGTGLVRDDFFPWSTHLAAVANQDDLLSIEPQNLDPLARLLSAAKLRHRLSTDPELRKQMPAADDLMRSVSLGAGSFLDLVTAGQHDIEEMRMLLAA